MAPALMPACIPIAMDALPLLALLRPLSTHPPARQPPRSSTIETRPGQLAGGVIKAVMGLRLDQEQEYQGADLSIHHISATPEYDG